MLTAIVSLVLQITSILATPCRPVEWPALQPPGLYEFGVPLPQRGCWASLGAAVTMYSLGIDAAVPVVGEEYQGDVYQDEQ